MFHIRLDTLYKAYFEVLESAEMYRCRDMEQDTTYGTLHANCMCVSEVQGVTKRLLLANFAIIFDP